MIKLLLSLLIAATVFSYNSSPGRDNETEMAIVDINNLSITEIQQYVDMGYLTYEKITRLYLDRIEAYNEQYNALITINEDALAQAKALDEEYQSQGRRSLIHGLPIIVKDNIDVCGMPTTNGTEALLDSYPYENAEVVQTLIDNGAIVIAKANMDEFAFNAAYTYSSFGFTNNAYNTLYSSYGSSGGSAVGVAANLAVFALGTDTGSSVRVPSSANGVVGIRPTFGLLSSDGVILFEESRDTVGVITKYVEDNAIVLGILTDNDYLSTIVADDLPLSGIRIGVIKNFMNPYTSSNSVDTGKTDLFIYDMMNDSIATLADLGAEIIYLDSFYLNYEFDTTNLCYNFNEYLEGTDSDIESLADLIADGGYTQYIEGYNGYYCAYDYSLTDNWQEYLDEREENIKLAEDRFDRYDLTAVIYPTIKTELMTNEEALYNKIYTPSSSTAPLIGWPAISVPMGFYDDLPYGMEIMAEADSESILYQIAAAYEQANPVYKLPEIAPALYSVPTMIDDLIALYDQYQYDPDYAELNEEVANYYLAFDGNSDTIAGLINEYQFLKEEIIKKEKTLQALVVTGGVASGLILVIIIVFIIKKRASKRPSYRS